MRTGDLRPKGRCSVCEQVYAIRGDGTIRRHRDWTMIRRRFCDGSLKAPKEAR